MIAEVRLLVFEDKIKATCSANKTTLNKENAVWSTVYNSFVVVFKEIIACSVVSGILSLDIESEEDS